MLCSSDGRRERWQAGGTRRPGAPRMSSSTAPPARRFPPSSPGRASTSPTIEAGGFSTSAQGRSLPGWVRATSESCQAMLEQGRRLTYTYFAHHPASGQRGPHRAAGRARRAGLRAGAPHLRGLRGGGDGPQVPARPCGRHRTAGAPPGDLPDARLSRGHPPDPRSQRRPRRAGPLGADGRLLGEDPGPPSPSAPPVPSRRRRTAWPPSRRPSSGSVRDGSSPW